MRLACTTLLICSFFGFGCATSQSSRSVPTSQQSIQEPRPDSNVAAQGMPAQELTEETIGKIVRSHFDELQTCYETTLANDNTLAGIVELELTIARDGSIQEGRLLKDGLGSAELNLCLVKKMVDWTFPPHTDDAITIEFPFSFSPKR